jgi:hypothetical protein
MDAMSNTLPLFAIYDLYYNQLMDVRNGGAVSENISATRP